MSHVPKRINFPRHNHPEPRRPAHQRSRRGGGLALFFAAIIAASLLASGVFFIRALVTGEGASALPGVSFDSAINDSVDFVLDLLPSAFSDDEGGQQVVLETSTPAPTVVATPSPTPLPSLDPASVKGSPLSLKLLTSSWEANGMKATVTAAEMDDYTGFAQPPVRVSLTKEAAAIDLAAFVYNGRDAIRDDWDTPSGERPSPKSGRSLPDHTSIWWNQNVVLVVLHDAGLSTDAREAFFDAHP